MTLTYSSEFIFSLKDQYQSKIDDMNEFISMYDDLVNKDNLKPLFSQTYKYDLFPKKKNYKKFKMKNSNAWGPTIPKNNIEKIKKTIKIILNKITEKNYNILIETLICEIGKFNTSDILDILAKEIMNKVIYDSNFHNIYIKLCNRIWSMKSWHDELITIVIDDDNKLYWHKNTSSDEENKLNGPFENEDDIREYTRKYINFRYILLDNLYKKFLERDEYIQKSNDSNIDEDRRYKLRRNLFGIIEFIGKLYKKNMISEKIIHVIFIELLNIHKKNDELPQEYIEMFCILWKISNEKIIAPIKSNLIDEYFNHIRNHIMKIKWPLRITFMLEDCIEKYEKKYKMVRKKHSPNKKYSPNSKQKNIRNNKKVSPNPSPKKAVKIDIFEDMENTIYQFKKDYDYHNVLSKLNHFQNHKEELIDMVIYNSLDETKHMKQYIELLKKAKFSGENIIDGVERTYNNIDDIRLDIPNAKENLLEFIRNLSLQIEIDQNALKSIILVLSNN